MAAPLSYRHRVVSEADVAFIRQLIREHPTASRRQLSKKLCQAWNWVQANGALRDMLCRGLMLQLQRAGLIELPHVATPHLAGESLWKNLHTGLLRITKER